MPVRFLWLMTDKMFGLEIMKMKNFSTKYRMWYYPANKESFGLYDLDRIKHRKTFYGLMYKTLRAA